jgi:excisionase family DNA binding protein
MLAQTPGRHHVQLFTVQETMAMLSVSRPQVYKLIHQGRLKPVYLDKRPRFPLEQLEELVRG